MHNHSQAGNSQTLWSRCRKSAKSLGVSIAKSRSSPVVHNHENASCTSKSVAFFLHRLCLSKHTESLKSCPDQGKVARCLHSSKSFTSNNWMYDGTGIRFCDWRFIHRARLNLLPTNDVKSRFFNDNSPTCRRCLNTSVNESLPHIICHCQPNMQVITKRHNKIQDRLTSTIHRGTFTVDKPVPGAPGHNRPDIVVTDGNKVSIIDITCPFENGEEALIQAANRKVSKYSYLIDFFQAKGLQAKVFGFVVGALGGWYQENDKVLDELQISMRYRPLFRKLCCADAIQISRDIYVEHLTGEPQA